MKDITPNDRPKAPKRPKSNNIPLTKELIIKCGGRWDEIQQDNSLVIDLPARIKIVFYDGDINCCSIYQDGKFIDLASGRIKTLTDLQNLCYSLTKYKVNVNDSTKH